MAVLDEVVHAFGPVRIAAEAAKLAQPGEALAGPGQQLMDVRLVPGVPEDPILRAVKDAMERQRQLDHAEIRAQVAAGLGDAGNQELTDLLGESAQLCIAQRAEIGWRADPIEDR